VGARERDANQVEAHPKQRKATVKKMAASQEVLRPEHAGMPL
jgi:hypothetical protein